MQTDEKQLQNFLENELKKYKRSKKDTIENLVSQSSSVPIYNKTEDKTVASNFNSHDFNQSKSSKSKSNGFDVRLFEEKMRSKLIVDHKSYQNYPRPYISVGEIIACLRSSFFNRMKYKVDESKMFTFPYLFLFQKRGNSLHEAVQEIYEMEMVNFSFISETFKVKGKIDGAKNNFLYEIKVIDKPITSFRQDDYDQANLYAFIANTEQNYKFDTITLVYVVGSLKQIIPFDVSVDLDRAKKLINNAIVLRSCIEKNKVPGEDFCKRGENCRWCLYKDYCSKQEETKSREETKKKDPVWLF
jgi:hypothetical protein